MTEYKRRSLDGPYGYWWPSLVLGYESPLPITDGIAPPRDMPPWWSATVQAKVFSVRYELAPCTPAAKSITGSVS